MSGAVPPPLLYLPGLQRDKRAFWCSRLISECGKVAWDRRLKINLEFRAPYLNQCPKGHFLRTDSGIFGCVRRVGWRIFYQKCGTCHCFGCKICATGPRDGSSWFRILAGTEGFLFTPTLPDRPWGPPSLLYVQWVPAFFPRDKAAGEWSLQLAPSNTVVTNEWSCTSLAPICLYGVERDGLIFTSNLQLLHSQNLKSRICSLILVFVCGPIHDIFTGSLQYQFARDVPTVSSFSHP